MLETLKKVGLAIVSALLTEKFIKEMIVFMLEKLAKLSSNKLDDEIVAKVKEALK